MASDEIWHAEGEPEYNQTLDEKYEAMLKPEWDRKCRYYEMDFLSAVLKFRNMSIQDAINSKDYIVKILAIMDRRIGRRTLKKIEDDAEYMRYPEWVKQFYLLRLQQ